MLYWALLDPHNSQHSFLQLVLSPIIHSMSGVVKVFKRMQHQHGSKAKALVKQRSSDKIAGKLRTSSGKPLVIIDASGDIQVMDNNLQLDAHQAAPPVKQPNPVVAAMVQATPACAEAVLCYDVAFYLLCHLSPDMCAGGSISTATAPWVNSYFPAPFAAFLQPHAKMTLFAFAAGNLLPLSMEVIYSSTRMMMLAATFCCPATMERLEFEPLMMPAKAFKNPLAAKSITDLWGFRWHQFLRFYFEQFGNRAVDAVLPKGKAVPAAVRASIRMVAAFTISGLMHEYQLWGAFGTLSGWNMGFFLGHCGVVLLENWIPAVFKAVLHRAHPKPKKHSRRSRTRSSGGGGAPKDTGCTNPASSEPRNNPTGDPTAPPTVLSAALDASSLAASTPTTASSERAPVSKKVSTVLWYGVGHLWALSVMVLLFIEPYRAAGTFGCRGYHPLGTPITPHVVSWVRKVLT